MIEHHLKGTSIGVQKLEQPDEQGNTFRLLIVDGRVDAAGTLIPNTGSGQVFWVYMDNAAASTVRQGFEDLMEGREPTSLKRVEIVPGHVLKDHLGAGGQRRNGK